jgi:hypothetical protein
LLEHPLRIEIGAVDRNGGPHDAPPVIRLSIVERQNHLLETTVKGVSLVNLIIVVADRPSGDAFVPSFNPPAVELLRLGTPLSAAFMPLVPDAS